MILTTFIACTVMMNPVSKITICNNKIHVTMNNGKIYSVKQFIEIDKNTIGFIDATNKIVLVRDNILMEYK